MNPQTVYGEIEREIVNELWDGLPEKYRKVIANDSDHSTKLFDEFCTHVEKDTQRKFDEYVATAYQPTSSEE